MAGDSARKKAQRLARQADYYERGAEGEEATATALVALPPTSWVVIHDVAWPGRKLANIDHVVIGPPGVFVIDSKNWSGRVMADRGVLRQNGYNRMRSVRSAQDAARAVSSTIAAVRPEHVVPVVCFTDPGPADHVIETTQICSTSTLVSRLTARPPVFTTDGVLSVAAELRRCLPAATAPRAATIRAPAAVRTQAVPASPRRGRRDNRTRRLMASVAGGTAFVVALSTGGFTAVTGVITDLVVEQTELPQDEPGQREPVQRDDGEKRHKNPATKKSKDDGQRQR